MSWTTNQVSKALGYLQSMAGNTCCPCAYQQTRTITPTGNADHFYVFGDGESCFTVDVDGSPATACPGDPAYITIDPTKAYTICAVRVDVVLYYQDGSSVTIPAGECVTEYGILQGAMIHGDGASDMTVEVLECFSYNPGENSNPTNIITIP